MTDITTSDHICETTGSVGGDCIHARDYPTNALVEITLETGGDPVLIEGGIAASGYYAVVAVDPDEYRAGKTKLVFAGANHEPHDGCTLVCNCFCQDCGAVPCGDELFDHLDQTHLNCAYE